MIVLDTHVLVWWVGKPEKLSLQAAKKIEWAKGKKEIFVSAISIWEIYMLIKAGRLQLTMDVDAWRKKIEGLPFLHFVPIDTEIAAKSVMLPGKIHQDPADRIIVATALQQGAVLVTADKKIHNYKYVRSCW